MSARAGPGPGNRLRNGVTWAAKAAVQRADALPRRIVLCGKSAPAESRVFSGALSGEIAPTGIAAAWRARLSGVRRAACSRRRGPGTVTVGGGPLRGEPRAPTCQVANPRNSMRLPLLTAELSWDLVWACPGMVTVFLQAGIGPGGSLQTRIGRTAAAAATADGGPGIGSQACCLPPVTESEFGPRACPTPDAAAAAGGRQWVLW